MEAFVRFELERIYLEISKLSQQLNALNTNVQDSVGTGEGNVLELADLTSRVTALEAKVLQLTSATSALQLETAEQASRLAELESSKHQFFSTGTDAAGTLYVSFGDLRPATASILLGLEAGAGAYTYDVVLPSLSSRCQAHVFVLLPASTNPTVRFYDSDGTTLLKTVTSTGLFVEEVCLIFLYNTAWRYYIE